MGSPVTIAGGTIYNPYLAEAGNNDIHVVWEGWSLPGVPVGWAKSVDGGASFTSSSVANNNAKYPMIASYGLGSTSTMVLTAGSINYPNGGDNNLKWSSYNGSSWTSTLQLSAVHTEYNLEGIAKSPYDGSVWKTYNASDKRLYIRRYNGTSWETPILVDGKQIFRCRHGQSAINSVGDIMVLWNNNGTTHTKLCPIHRIRTDHRL